MPILHCGVAQQTTTQWIRNGETASQMVRIKAKVEPPLLSNHLTKILIGSSVSQIAISESSRKRPPPPSVKLLLVKLCLL